MAGKLRLWRWIGTVAVFAVALPVVHLQLRDRRLGKRLVDGVLERSKDRPRPVVGVPVGTTFEACLGPVLDEAPDGGIFSFDAPQPARDALKAILEGKPPEDAGVDVWAELDAMLPWVDRVLACTHAPSVGDTPGLGPFVMSGPRDSRLWRSEVFVGKAVALNAVRGRAGADPSFALRRCGELLAFARDAALDRGLVGAMSGGTMLRTGTIPCARLLARVPGDEALRFAEEVRVVRKGTPGFDEILSTETLQMQLMGWGRQLAPSDFERLPENAKELVRTPYTLEEPSLLSRLAQYFAWSDYVRRLEEMRAVAKGPSRDADLDRLVAEQSVFERLMDQGSLGGSFSAYAGRYDSVGAFQDLLESTARVRAGEAPLPSVRADPIDGGVALSVEYVSSVSPRAVERVSVELREP